MTPLEKYLETPQEERFLTAANPVGTTIDQCKVFAYSGQRATKTEAEGRQFIDPLKQHKLDFTEYDEKSLLCNDIKETKSIPKSWDKMVLLTWIARQSLSTCFNLSKLTEAYGWTSTA